MTEPQLRTRIAPTPSGFLHLGNAFSFILTWLIARKSGGTLILRIDDLDASRKRPEYVNDIFTNLDWLGIDFDEGPSGPDEFEKGFSQGHRTEIYRAALGKLREQRAVFACDCSRSTIQRAGCHPKTCRQEALDLDCGEFAWRVSTTDVGSMSWHDAICGMQSINVDSTMCDFAVRRKDGVVSYQLASVIDDADYRVNAIVRGADLLPSTAAQLYLAHRLQIESLIDASFFHHPLLLNDAGEKLSKSDGAMSLQALRNGSTKPAYVYQTLSPHLGMRHPVNSISEALLEFVVPFQM